MLPPPRARRALNQRRGKTCARVNGFAGTPADVRQRRIPRERSQIRNEMTGVPIPFRALTVRFSAVGRSKTLSAVAFRSTCDLLSRVRFSVTNQGSNLPRPLKTEAVERLST